VRVAEKSNEITAIPKLLDMLELTGSTVTIDAMGCQKLITSKIVAKGADYAISLKGNQGTLHENIKSEYDGVSPDMLSTRLGACHETVDKGHGRIEIRRYWQMSQLGWIERTGWDGLRSIGIVDGTRIIGDQETTERRYFICSFTADVKRFAEAVRQHWSVESTLHWSMDVVFNEDRCRMRRDSSAENFALMRRITLSIFKQLRTKKSRSIKGCRARAGWDVNYLASALGVGPR
jgi:predicted transposase YbfD/YdcC